MMAASPPRVGRNGRWIGAVALIGTLGLGAGASGQGPCPALAPSTGQVVVPMQDPGRAHALVFARSSIPGRRAPELGPSGPLSAGNWVELGGLGSIGGLIPSVFLRGGIVAPDGEIPRDFWVVRTHECPQVMGSDPWPCLRLLRLDDRGELAQGDVGQLLVQAARPVLVIVNGDLMAGDLAVSQGLWAHAWLNRLGVLPPDVVTIVFDWPGQKVYDNPLRDVNEKCRRAFIAGNHLARILQSFPPNARVCLLGQSYGGRIVPSALHLLGGGHLSSEPRDPGTQLVSLRPDLHVRAIVIEAADDHFWLDPDKKLGRSLTACEGFLNLYNSRDKVLLLYPFLFTGDRRRALGRVGLLRKDFKRLGPVASRYAERDIQEFIGREHTLLGALGNPRIAEWIAPYIWAVDPIPGASRVGDRR